MNKDLKGKFAFTLGATHVGIFNNTRRVGFTLAEVLITLGIIGVVSAMTIPTLIKNYQEKATVTKVKQAYSILSQAYRLAIAENGPINYWELETTPESYSHTKFANYLKPHLKLTADCIGEAEEYVSKYCTPIVFYKKAENASTFVLNNGMLVGVRIWSPKGNDYWANGLQKFYGVILVMQKGDKWEKGKTAFDFYIGENGIIPFGMQGTRIEFEKACNPNISDPYPGYTSDDNMYGCTAWVIQKENMDYWECPEKLGWNKASSCDE